ncbi:uncharacterized protein [Littorina saxatilis]
MLLEECISRDIADPVPPTSSSPNLALPADLWHDFQALQAATHLDTASLIRRLITQYGRSGPPEENPEQASPSGEHDLEASAVVSACSDTTSTHTTTFTGGETEYCDSGEIVHCGRSETACGEIDVVTPGGYSAAAPTTVDEDNDGDFLVLDLSTRNPSTNKPASALPLSNDVDMGYAHDNDDGSDGVEKPLDLTMCKPNGASCPPSSLFREDSGGFVINQAPEAHRAPSDSILSALSPEALRTATPSLPRAAHSSQSGTAPSSGHVVSSSLFNLSGLQCASPRVHSGGQISADRHQTKVSTSSGGSSPAPSSSKQKIVQHFLSLPAGHVVSPDNLTDVYNQQALGAVTGTLLPPEALRHISLGSAIQFSPVMTPATPPPSAQSQSHHASSVGSHSVSTSGTMQLPTVTSLEFRGDGTAHERYRTSPDAAKTSQVVTQTMTSLPTSGSAILLDVGSGGLMATAGGFNFPLMATSTGGLVATGTGGLVAIPFLQALPEAFAAAAAAAAAAAQGQQPNVTSTVTTQPQPLHPPPAPPQVPPPPPYSAAVASTTPPKAYKAKIGRPRGQPKAQKPVCKDMKLLTENTLFPGVYTSILKLPWSKRSRGKSSAKIKDVVSNTGSTAVSGAEQHNPSMLVQHEPGEVINSPHQQHQLHQQQQKQPPVSTVGSTEANHHSPLSVPNQEQAASLTSSLSSSASASSTSSVMMVYHNTVMSDQGKPVRRRGRPPKLPVLSQLLSDRKTVGHNLNHHLVEGQHTPMDSDPAASIFSLAPSTMSSLSAQHNFDASVAAFPSNLSESCVNAFSASLAEACVSSVKQEPMEVSDSDVSKLFPALIGTGRAGDHSDIHGQGQQHDLHLKQELSRGAGVALDEGEESRNGEGADDTKAGCSIEEQLQDASLETRFNILANKLGLEIGSPYHASLVLSQANASNSLHGNSNNTTVANNSALYQQMMLSSRSMVEMKPRRRQLNNLIKPSDDCVYTSFRIRPRLSGRRGGKRGGRKRGSKYDVNPDAPSFAMAASECGDSPREKDGVYADGSEVSVVAGSGAGSAVITERIPGAGEVPQRLYQDLYHCKLCNEMLPADSSLLHTCISRTSPPLRSCQECGTMYLSSDPTPHEGSGQPTTTNMCEECALKGQPLSSPALSPSGSVHDQPVNTSDGFACQPCGVHFVNIADYIQHRRTAHLEKMTRQPRKTHTLKTLPCPATGCPRLFHMQAELRRHIAADHPEEAEQGAGLEGEGDVVATTSASPHHNTSQDVDVETVPHPEPEETEGTEEENPQFTCIQDKCGQRFSTPLDLLEHVQSSHEGISQWPCPLPGCSRHFAAERHLRVHLLMHKDEKPLKCPFCNYRCRQKNAMNWHMKKHPESAGHYRKFATMSSDS